VKEGKAQKGVTEVQSVMGTDCQETKKRAGTGPRPTYFQRGLMAVIHWCGSKKTVRATLPQPGVVRAPAFGPDGTWLLGFCN
jgi:hypothetical protein